MSKKSEHITAVNNPFKGRDKEEVRREIDQCSKPIRREEVMKRIKGTPPKDKL